MLTRHIRLITLVSFETRDGWTESQEAIIDTGVPISIIPRQVWEPVRYGLISNAETQIDIGGNSVTGKFGQVTLRFHDTEDEERTSPTLTLKADLLLDDRYPIILGFEDFLTDVALYSDFPQQEAFLIFRSPTSE